MFFIMICIYIYIVIAISVCKIRTKCYLLLGLHNVIILWALGKEIFFGLYLFWSRLEPLSSLPLLANNSSAKSYAKASLAIEIWMLQTSEPNASNSSSVVFAFTYLQDNCITSLNLVSPWVESYISSLLSSRLKSLKFLSPYSLISRRLNFPWTMSLQ